MMQLKQPIDYAKAACETMMRKFEAPKLPPVGHFHYHQGVFLSGVYQTYLLTKDERYFNYMKAWVDSIVAKEDGRIHWYDPGELDDMQPGILLFPLYERTGESCYRKAIGDLMERIDHYPKNAAGGFYHKECCPQQMWLDGLYMGGPLCTMYGAAFGEPKYFDIAAQQALLMEEKTKDPKTGLWYHAWDEARLQPWADKETGLSSEFWGRSIGWVPVAILDEMDLIPEDHPLYPELKRLVTELLTAVCKYQSEDGRWYQVVDKGDKEGNWLENSCSCLFAAALAKAVRKGFLPESYLEKAKRGYEGVIRSITWEGEDIQIGNICIGTCVGDYKHYCERPVSTNDLHGAGAFLLMNTELQRALDVR